MSWRPNDWKIPYNQSKNRGFPETVALRSAYEAGADAMLKAIWKMAEESPNKTFTFDSRVTNIFGIKEVK